MSSTVQYTVAVDKLRMQCVGKIPALENKVNEMPVDRYVISEQVILQRNYHLLHPGFSHGFNILLNNNLMGQLCYGNTGEYRFTQQDTSQITIENHVLYQAGWLNDLRLVLETLELDFHKYSFMEIAVDGLELVGRFGKLNYDKRLKMKRHALVRPIYDNRIHADVGFTIGSSKSEKHITIYDKSEEIKESNKQYISEFWIRNGLSEQSGNIHRCELRLYSKALKAFSGDLMTLNDPAYLASYFKTVAGHYLEFINQNQIKKRLHLINWLKFNNIKITKQEITKKAFTLNRYKTMLRNLFEEYVVTSDELYLNTLASLAIRYNLMNWIRKTISRWIREFRLVT